MQLTIGFSPCPNDTFMVEALIHQRIPSTGITWQAYIEDVETLNRWALEAKLDVTKMSFSTWLRVQGKYDLLTTGAALGHGCGPLVIAKKPLSEEQILSGLVAIPGELTTANLLFTLRYPTAKHKVPMLFSDIEKAVLQEEVLAGVIIHENRFTYQQKGLVKIVDLGEYWEVETGCPIPLGAFCARKTLGSAKIQEIGDQLGESVRFAFAHKPLVMPYVRQFAQEMDQIVMEAHIDTYVNEFSLELGDQGLKAIKILQERASQAGLI